MDPFYGGQALIGNDLPDFENLDYNDPTFSARETCGPEISWAD